LTLDIAKVERRIAIMILFSKVRFLGVFLSPRAFLKSLITLLKEKAVLAVEDEREGCPPALIRAEPTPAVSEFSSKASESPRKP